MSIDVSSEQTSQSNPKNILKRYSSSVLKPLPLQTFNRRYIRELKVQNKNPQGIAEEYNKMDEASLSGWNANPRVRLAAFQNNLFLRASYRAAEFAYNSILQKTVPGYTAEQRMEAWLQRYPLPLNDQEKQTEHFNTTYLGYTQRDNLQRLSVSTPEYRKQMGFFGLSRDVRLGHTIISGGIQTGKSTLMEFMATQDMLRGEGVCFITIDPDSIKRLLAVVPPERTDDVVVLHPADLENVFGLDLFEGDEKSMIVDNILDIFQDFWEGDQTDKILYFMVNTLLLILENKEELTIMDAPRIINDRNFRFRYLKKSRDLNLVDFWVSVFPSITQEVQSTLIKLDKVLKNAIIRNSFCTEKKTMIKDILLGNKIFLVNLEGLSHQTARIFGSLVLKKITQTAHLRQRNGFEKLYHVHVDEFSKYTDSQLLQYTSQLRKAGISLTFSQKGTFARTKTIAPEEVFGAFNSRITFNTTDPFTDYTNANKDINLDAVIQQLPVGTALVETFAHGLPLQPLVIITEKDALETPYGGMDLFGSEQDVERKIESIKQKNTELYTESTEQVEQRLMQRMSDNVPEVQKGQQTTESGKPKKKTKGQREQDLLSRLVHGELT